MIARLIQRLVFGEPLPVVPRVNPRPGDDELAEVLGLKRVVVVSGDDAWTEFQQQVEAEKAKARAGHQAVKPIEKRQQDLVHSALAGERSIPSRDAAA